MSGQSKLKILYVMKFLTEESSAENVLSASDICRLLFERCGIEAERKGIYSDIEVLKEFGLDIRQKKGGNPGYYFAGDVSPVPAAAPKQEAKKKEITVDIPFGQSAAMQKKAPALKDMSDVGSISYLVKDKKGGSAYALKVNTDTVPYRAKVKNYVSDPDGEPEKRRLDNEAMTRLREICERIENI